VPEGLELWPVLRARPTFNQFLQVRQRVLFEGPRSGTGKVSDWKTGCLLAKDYEVILAGGLSPANVAEAIDAVRPFGVDVSSGVEEAPGRKSPVLIESFVSRARAAFARSGNGEQ
jgi:phosphoribosylanthranilate isomerase